MNTCEHALEGTFTVRDLQNTNTYNTKYKYKNVDLESFESSSKH